MWCRPGLVSEHILVVYEQAERKRKQRGGGETFFDKTTESSFLLFILLRLWAFAKKVRPVRPRPSFMVPLFAVDLKRAKEVSNAILEL